MTNEEKIFDMLAQISGHLDRMETSQATMQSDIDSMKGDIGKLQTDVARIGVTQENVVLKRLDLLSEGHDTLLTTLAPNSRVDALESDVVVLKAAVKALSRDVAELKKAE